MNDSRCMGGLDRCAYLGDDDGDFFDRKRSILLGVPLQELAARPFDGQKVEPGIGLADFYGTHHVRVLYSSAVLSFADKTCDRGAIMAQFFAKNLEGDGTVGRMFGSVHRRSAALSDLTLYGIPGYLGADQALMRHAGESNRNRFMWIG